MLDHKGKCVGVILFDRDDVVAYKCKRYTGMGSKGIYQNGTVIVEPRNSFDECNDGDVIAYQSSTYGILCGEYRSGLIMFYPKDPMQMPPEFKKGVSGYTDWSACPVEVIGDERLFGKVIYAISNFE